MGEVFECIVDGTSGLVPEGVDGKAIVVGVCSLGTMGKAYLISKHSDVKAMLDTGPLADSVQDMLATGGQNPIIVAVPAQGQVGGYISPVVQSGEGPSATVSGYPAKNGDIVVHVTTSGALSSAKVKISFDGGQSFEDDQSAREQIVIGTGDDATGATLLFASGAELVKDANYTFTVRTSVGPVRRIGDSASPLLAVDIAEDSPSDSVLAAAELVIQIVRSGERNEGTYQLSLDGGDSYDKIRTIPLGGVVTVPDYGVKISFPDDAFMAGTTYTCNLLAPVPSIVHVMQALESPLSLYDVEFIVVAGATDSVD